MTELLSKHLGAVGTVLGLLLAAIVALFKIVISNHKTDRDQLLTTIKTLQTQLEKSHEQSNQQSQTFYQQLQGIHEQRIKESHGFFEKTLTLSNNVVSSDLGTKEALSNIRDQLKAMQEDGKDEHDFVQGLLQQLAERKGDR